MQSMKRWLVSAMVLAAVSVRAAEFGPVSVNEAAFWGATHVAEITEADFSGITATNTAYVFSNLVTAVSNTAVEFRGFKLVDAFDTTVTNLWGTWPGSVTMKVGDAADDDFYITSTELAAETGPVWTSWPREALPVIALTTSTFTNVSCSFVTITNLAYESATFTNVYWSGASTGMVVGILGATTQVISFTSAATSPSITQWGRKYYTTNAWMRVTFTPNAAESLAAQTKGKVKLYWKMQR
jgi:hypothetical protein